MRALRQFAPDNAGVRMTLTRLEVERWRRAAYQAYADGDYEAAQVALDSVAVLFPGCSWCEDLPGLMEADSVAAESIETAVKPIPFSELSLGVRQEVDAAYRAAQQSFECGELRSAIAEWERVELLAPGYLSVREYLVAAYKFVGVELYGEKRREEALRFWKQALELDPGSAEIKDYIKRTENEIRKLRELSYEN
jgi:tetratricopeptide (TPR) repeat protein